MSTKLLHRQIRVRVCLLRDRSISAAAAMVRRRKRSKSKSVEAGSVSSWSTTVEKKQKASRLRDRSISAAETMSRRRERSKSKSVEVGSVSSGSTTVEKTDVRRLQIKTSDDLTKARAKFALRVLSPEESKLYSKQLKESGGFDMPSFPGFTRCLIRPCTSSFISDEKLKTFAIEAIKNFKTTVDQNANLRFVKMVKACYELLGCTVKYYITFEAIDEAADHDQVKTYQALISRKFTVDVTTVLFSRLKPTPAPAL